MNNFKIIYKILRLLDKNKGDENFDYKVISPFAFGIPYSEWEQIMIELQEAGYIRGIVYKKNLQDKFYHILEPISPSITLKGMEYLAENSMMAKARDALKMIGDIF